MARIGRDLPSDYGPPLIKPSIAGTDFFNPSRNFGWYLFTGLDAEVVGRNIFLDGNSFRDSRSVDKNILVGGIQSGITLTFPKARVTLLTVHKTKEYKTQTSSGDYGALTVSYRF